MFNWNPGFFDWIIAYIMFSIAGWLNWAILSWIFTHVSISFN